MQPKETEEELKKNENVIGRNDFAFEEKDGKFTMFEDLQKHVYFVNDTSIERTKRMFLQRFMKRLPIEELELLFNFKMEDIELEGQYKQGIKFSCEIKKASHN